MAFELFAPERPEEASQLLRDQDPERVAVLAGGTDLLFDLGDGRARPARVVSLRRLPWATWAWHGPDLEIGSTLPLSRLEADRSVRERVPGLWSAVHAVGGIALRHRATLGGNLARASPASDLLPILMALNAQVRLFSIEGRREFPVDQFVKSSRKTALKPGELIESVRLPDAGPSEYLWQRVRPANDISQVGVAVAVAPTAPIWRVALGGISPRPRRIPEAEKRLPSRFPSELEIELAAQEAAQRAPFLTDKRASEAYRRRLVSVLVRRAVRAVVEQLGRRSATAPGGPAT